VPGLIRTALALVAGAVLLPVLLVGALGMAVVCLWAYPSRGRF
jgi:hypothetical protein